MRAPLQHRYPPPFPERLSPNTLLNIAVSAPRPSVCLRSHAPLLNRHVLCLQNSPLCRGPFPPRVLSQIQRAQLLNSQVPTVHTHMHTRHPHEQVRRGWSLREGEGSNPGLGQFNSNTSLTASNLHHPP